MQKRNVWNDEFKKPGKEDAKVAVVADSTRHGWQRLEKPQNDTEAVSSQNNINARRSHNIEHQRC